MACPVKLGGEQRAPVAQYLDVDMRRPSGISNRYDCAEGEAPGGVGPSVTEALESRIARGDTVIAGMQIDAVCVALPDFNSNIRYGPPVGVQNAPSEMENIATRLAYRAFNSDQVGIIVAWHAYRVEWTLVGTGRRRKHCQGRLWYQQRRYREYERATCQATHRRIVIAHHVVLRHEFCP